MAHHLAQLNVARAVAPLESDALASFLAEIDPVNALADTAPGFVWRLEDEGGDAPGATGIRAYADPWMIVNLSVWESTRALWDFAYRGRHLEVMRRRREWFTRLAESHLVLWWIPAGELPTIEDATNRLEHLRAHGPTPRAFTFKQAFAPPQHQPSTDDLEREIGDASRRTSKGDSAPARTPSHGWREAPRDPRTP